MIVSNAAIKRSTTVFVLLLLIFIMGIHSWIVLPRESNPEVIVPYITVGVSYEGVSPEDMESLITIPIERKLAGLSGVKEMESTTVEGFSHIFLEFEADTDIDTALQKVRDKVDQTKGDIPQEADDPIVSEINVSEFPVMIMGLSGDLPLSVLTKIAEDLEDRIETVEGVLDVEIIGGVEREIQIEVDPERVAEFGISFTDLISVLRLENVNTPGGAMELGEAKFLMRTPGEFSSPDEIDNLVVKMGPEGTVFLRDIAKVWDGFKELDSISRLNGTSSVTMTVVKRSGANIVSMADEVNTVIDETLEELPAGMDVALIWDESEWIRDMVSELVNSILTGLLLVLVVIFIFLGFSNAIFVALAIPVSMFITLAVLNAMDVTLNMVVLFSLILALGMLVDNGIVVVENIYRHAQMGLDRKEAARIGTAEVAWPITSSTITTLAGFVPLFFWPGIFGEFMYFLPLTLCISLTASLFVGLVVNPALTSVLMRVTQKKKDNEKKKHHYILRVYSAFLRGALRWRAVTVTTAFVILVSIIAIFVKTAQVEFMPDTEPPQATIDLECPEGTSLDASDLIVKHIEELLQPHMADFENVVSNAGSQGVEAGGGSLRGGGNSNNLSRVTLDFRKLEECEVLPSEVLRRVRNDIKGITGAEVQIAKMEMGPPTGPPVNVEISGDEYEVLASLAEKIKGEIKDIPGLVDLTDNYNKGKPEVRVIVDREQAWRTGLNTQLVGLTVQAAINGRKAAEYREGDEEYDVIVRFPKAFREDISNIEAMSLIAMDGRRVPFSSVARIEQGTGVGTIRRIDRKRTISVSAEVATGYKSPEVLKQVQGRLADFDLPTGYALDYTGENEDVEETQTFLIQAFVVAVFLIALVLITQFNSLIQPLIILSSVVLSLGGVFLGLYLFDMPFGILMTGLGCISLAGVVVNNAIVLIDFINQLRAQGAPTKEAIVEAGITRFRPVMLTAITTILGLIPMATGVSYDFTNFKWLVGGEMSQWWRSMAIAVIFGLSFATILTLVVVPVLYSLAESFARLFAKSSAPSKPPAPAPAPAPALAEGDGTPS